MESRNTTPVGNYEYIQLNPEEEYWFIRWVVMRRNWLKAVAELEQVKRIHARKLSEDKNLIEIERLKTLLAQVHKEFIPINPTKRVAKKHKRK